MTWTPAVLEVVEELVMKRRWLLDEVKKFERKYGIDSQDFYEKWSNGLLPEPDDSEIHGDFVIWYGLIEELHRVEQELRKMLKELPEEKVPGNKAPLTGQHKQ